MGGRLDAPKLLRMMADVKSRHRSTLYVLDVVVESNSACVVKALPVIVTASLLTVVNLGVQFYFYFVVLTMCFMCHMYVYPT